MLVKPILVALLSSVLAPAVGIVLFFWIQS